jgi:hypothetical protein
MTAAKLDVWIWVLLYGGLALLGLGVAVQRDAAALGWVMVGVGALVAAAGVLLIVVRARLPDRS